MGVFDFLKKAPKKTPGTSETRINSSEFDSALDAIEFMVLKNNELKPQWTDFWGRMGEDDKPVLVQLSRCAVNPIDTNKDLLAVLKAAGREDLLGLIDMDRGALDPHPLFLFAQASARQIAEAIDLLFVDHLADGLTDSTRVQRSYLLHAEHEM
jgi:hypothetical protein